MSFNPYFEAIERRYATRRVFVSYHHGLDRPFYEQFSNLACDAFEVVYDNSVRQEIDSENPDYVMRHIREDFITGTSCTIVLCGAETWKRKYVDWEIKATLDKSHGLIGVYLPTAIDAPDGCVRVPDRFLDNWESGYALWYAWKDFTESPVSLRTWVQDANGRLKESIRNAREVRSRNG